MWCHLIHLGKTGKIDVTKEHRHRITKYIKYTNEVNYEGISFPVDVRQIPKIEEMNDIRINVFYYDEDDQMYPYYISKIKSLL